MMMQLRRRAGWSLVLLLSLAIVAYAGVLLVIRTFPDELGPSLHVHSFAISLHIVGAILTLALGPLDLDLLLGDDVHVFADVGHQVFDLLAGPLDFELDRHEVVPANLSRPAGGNE